MIGTRLLSRRVFSATSAKLVNANQFSVVKAMAPKIMTSSYRSFSTPAKITIEEAKKMPRHYNEMPNDILLTMAASGDQQAREERVIREVMSVDGIEWQAARGRFHNILNANRRGLFLATLPYKVGIFLSFSAGVLSFPMIFHLDSVLLFNDYFVTTDVPDDKDLETPLEVGSWAWNWMEPPLGQISFFLLCMQYARAQLENLGAKPYTASYKARRAANLCKEFPMYDVTILTSFSEGDSFTPDNFDAIH